MDNRTYVLPYSWCAYLPNLTPFLCSWLLCCGQLLWWANFCCIAAMLKSKTHGLLHGSVRISILCCSSPLSPRSCASQCHRTTHDSAPGSLLLSLPLPLLPLFARRNSWRTSSLIMPLPSAISSGVLPISFFVSALAPFCSSTLTTSAFPLTAA
ncbi:hypothetical protein K440DRAFT_919 [Wilcoxina mikolae CBS 423.85]|nr:hypothetical protein K440DRAFT_919 [Wilcoxina mikolae CBS 423.85]